MPGSPVSRAHSWQAVLSKSAAQFQFRLVLARITQEQKLAKIDPDTGLQYDEGPGRNRFLTGSVSRCFRNGMVQASVSRADAREVTSGLPIPEAPRTIADVLGTLDRLPFHLQARAEYEQVGRTPLGDGFVGVSIREFRGSLSRPFLEGAMRAGVYFLIASGYTGQTTEVLAAPGGTDPVEQIVGVRLPSYVSASWTWHFLH